MGNRQERPDRNNSEYSENQEVRKICPVPLLISIGEKTQSTQTRRNDAFHVRSPPSEHWWRSGGEAAKAKESHLRPCRWRGLGIRGSRLPAGNDQQSVKSGRPPSPGPVLPGDPFGIVWRSLMSSYKHRTTTDRPFERLCASSSDRLCLCRWAFGPSTTPSGGTIVCLTTFSFRFSCGFRTPMLTFTDHIGQVRSRAYFEGACLHAWVLRHQLDGMVEVPGFEHEESAQLFFRLGKGAISD